MLLTMTGIVLHLAGFSWVCSLYIPTHTHTRIVDDTVHKPTKTLIDWLSVWPVVLTSQGNCAAFMNWGSVGAVQCVCVWACGMFLFTYTCIWTKWISGGVTAWLSISLCVIIASTDPACCLLCDQRVPFYVLASFVLSFSYSLYVCLSLWGALRRCCVYCAAWICLQSWLHHQLQCRYITH